MTLVRSLTSWQALAAALVAALGWIAGSAGWIGIGPNDRLTALESAARTAEVNYQITARQVAELRSDVSFTVDLLCVQLASGTRSTPADGYLQRRCDAVTRRLAGVDGTP